MRGGVLKLVGPLAAADLPAGDGPAEPLVAWDDLGEGDWQPVVLRNDRLDLAAPSA